MKKAAICFFTLLLLGFISCKKESLEVYDPNWTGEWHSAEPMTDNSGKPVEIVFIVNGSNSKYAWICDTACLCNCTKYTEGPVEINRRHNAIYIGKIFNERVKIKIDAEPYQDATGAWYCGIKGNRSYTVKMKKK